MSLIDALRSNSPSTTSCRVSLANERNVKKLGQAIQHNTHVEELILGCPATFNGNPWSSSASLLQFVTNSATLTNISLESWGGRVVNDDGSSSVFASTCNSLSSGPLSCDRSFEGCLLEAIAANDYQNENIHKLALRFHDRRRVIDGPTLAKLITKTKTLSHLYLDASIHHHDATTIASSLATNSSIKEIRLDCIGVEQAVSRIVKRLHLSKSLSRLHLEHVDIVVARALREFLSASLPVVRLRSLVLDATDADDIQAGIHNVDNSIVLQEIMTGLLNAFLKKIESLTLKRFKMTTSSASLLKTFVSSDMCILKELSLLSCSFEGASFHEVLEGMSKTKTIVKFVVERPSLAPLGMGVELRRMLQTNTSLETLSLRGDFGRGVAAYIAKGLAASTNLRLKRLDLQDGVGDEGFQELFAVLGGYGGPFELDLGRKGAHDLVTTCQPHRPYLRLSHLDLEGCRLGARDLDLLLTGLERVAPGQQPYLKKLNLSGNIISNNAAQRLAALISGTLRYTLQTLLLRRCCVSAPGSVNILRSLADNAALTELCLDVENHEDTSSGEPVWRCLAKTLPLVRGLKKLVMIPSGMVGWGYVSGLEATIDEVMRGFQANTSLTSVMLFCTLAPPSLLLTVDDKLAHYCLRNRYCQLTSDGDDGEFGGAGSRQKISGLLPVILSSCFAKTKNKSVDAGPSASFVIMKEFVTDHMCG